LEDRFVRRARPEFCVIVYARQQAEDRCEIVDDTPHAGMMHGFIGGCKKASMQPNSNRTAVREQSATRKSPVPASNATKKIIVTSQSMHHVLVIEA
jgi:hypothetical protein